MTEFEVLLLSITELVVKNEVDEIQNATNVIQPAEKVSWDTHFAYYLNERIDKRVQEQNTTNIFMVYFRIY